jgi:MFS transporter, FHS family, L-fucose permease
MALGSASGQSVSVSESGSAQYGKALAVVTTLFFMWGFLTTLNDTLIPHLKQIFTLNYFEAMLVQLSFFGSYFIFAQPAAKLIDYIGYKRTMVVGLAVMAAGVFLFVPAAGVQSYGFFLAAEIVLAAGVTTLQVAANPYVTVLGPAQTASSRLNLTQAFNSLGTVIAPLFGSAFIVASAAEMATMSKIQQAASLKLPYAGIGIVLLAMAAIIALFKLPRIQATQEFRGGTGTLGTIWSHRHVWLGAIAIFLYVGAEVAVGSSLVIYMTQHDIAGFSAQRANIYLIFFWGGLMVGRFIGSGLLQKLPTGPVVGVCAIGATALIATSMLTSGHFAMWTMLLVGLFNSIMFPSIFTLGTAHMGPLTGKASGLLVQAIVGGAIIPPAQGYLMDRIGVHHGFILPLLCYLFIIYYGFRGSRPTGASMDLVATA